MNKDPKTPTRRQLASMSDNEDMLEEHPGQNVIRPPSDKPAEFGMGLSDLSVTRTDK